MSDPVADYYSQPQQSGGTFRIGRQTNFAIPIKRPTETGYLKQVPGGKGDEDYKKLVDHASKANKAKRYKYPSDDSSDEEPKKKRKPKKKMSKHKRSRIDEALGDDTY